MEGVWNMLTAFRFAPPVLLISACFLLSGLVAQDDKPVLPEKKSEVPAEKKKAPSLDEELIKVLDPNAEKVESDIDRLERAIKGMREAQKRIESQDTGNKTRETQEQVVRDLDKLIELIRQQLQQAQQKQSQQKQKQQKDKQKPLANVELDPQNSQKQSQKQGEKKQSLDGTDKSKQSTDRTAADKAREEEAARREQLIKDVWGHLPPALRQELSNAYKENYLPKYDDQVRKYYESLAEKNRKNKLKSR